MNTITTTLTTTAIFSEDGVKRYLIRKVWDADKPRLAIIMLVPSSASGIELDTTTQLVLNNAFRMGYGQVDILNLFSTLNDFDLKRAEAEDSDNIKVIVESAQTADVVVYASGVGKAKNKAFQLRQKQVLEALRPYEAKLNCLTDKNGKARLQHPLSPAVRVWYFSPLKISELISNQAKPCLEASANETKKGNRKRNGKEAASP